MNAFEYRIIPVTPFAQNCSLIWCTKTRLAMVTDPGGEVDKIRRTIDENEVELDKILITHGHLDHAGKTAELARATGVPIFGPHKDDLFWIRGIPEHCKAYGFEGDSFQPDHWLQDGDKIPLGELQFDVIHTPGHTPGHVVFVEKQQKFALVGDVIFQGSIGRTDFPKSDHASLIHSIREKLFPLGDDIQFIPGHGPMSTFKDEKHNNPFVADKNFG